jgi:hypothetical protein
LLKEEKKLEPWRGLFMEGILLQLAEVREKSSLYKLSLDEREPSDKRC